MKKLGIALLAFSGLAAPAAAEVRVNGRFDTNTMAVEVFGYQHDFDWTGREAELEVSWKSNKLVLVNGLAFGFRKEGERDSEGTYVTARLFKRVPLGKRFELNPSVGMVFGTPGIAFHKTWEQRAPNGDLLSYVHSSPVPAERIPHYQGVQKMGVRYPEVSVAVRAKFWRLHLEPVFSARFISFAQVQTDYATVRYREKREVGLSAGVRIGFRLF